MDMYQQSMLSDILRDYILHRNRKLAGAQVAAESHLLGQGPGRRETEPPASWCNSCRCVLNPWWILCVLHILGHLPFSCREEPLSRQINVQPSSKDFIRGLWSKC